MDSKNITEDVQQLKTRVQTLQESWTTGEAARPNAIDWTGRIKDSVQKLIRSKMFLVATILLTIISVPFVLAPFFSVPLILILPLCPTIWMVVGMWIMLVQAKRNDGKVGVLGFEFITIGQYVGFGVSVASVLAYFFVGVQGCTDLGRLLPDMQEILFWTTGLGLGVVSLMAALRWKFVIAAKKINAVYEGDSNDGMITGGTIAWCFVLGAAACLSVIGIPYGVAVILFGIMLSRYRNDLFKLEIEAQSNDSVKAEHQMIEPTWKKISG